MTRYSVDFFESHDIKALEEKVKLFCLKYKIQVINVSYAASTTPGADTTSYSAALAYSYSEKDYYTSDDEINLITATTSQAKQ